MNVVYFVCFYMYECNMRIDCEFWWVEVKGLIGDEDGLFLFIEYFFLI